MSTTVSTPPDASELAGARSAVYRFLRAALECPDRHNHAWLAGPDFARGLALLCARTGVPVPEEPFFPADPADAQSDYLACFEIGLNGPPVPLLASHYNRHEPVPATIHEHVMFYRRFGASVPAGSPDPPDHLRHELEFLAHLDDLWASGRIDTLSATMARIDFLSRQLARWVRAAAEAGGGLPPVYTALLRVLVGVVEEDLAGSREARRALAPEQEAP